MVQILLHLCNEPFLSFLER
uniref:Uncharacterized protein n=1 Tax=Arundo donax TaxID=35708 RepID=A0A0A8ZTL0_ARUDO